VTPEQFREQMSLLRREGFTSLSLQEYGEAALGLRELPRRSVLVTFDDGFSDNHQVAWPIAAEFDIKLNLFVCTGLVMGERLEAFEARSFAAQANKREFPELWQPLTWRQLREMMAGGVGLGFHSHRHGNFGRMSWRAMADDLSRGTSIFKQQLDEPPRFFAFPFGHYGSYPEEAVHLLRRHGMELLFTTELGRTPLVCENRLFSRIVVHEEDDAASFRRKLFGGYNWVGSVRRLGYSVRSVLRSRSSRWTENLRQVER
jgi:peptidoglycan/xylan/chitin deacetylase (PgdA/CDA1 family)